MAQMALDAARERITGLEAELETAAQRNTDLVEEVKVLSERVRTHYCVGGRVGASSLAQCRPQGGGRIKRGGRKEQWNGAVTL